MLNFKTEMIYLISNGNDKIKIGYCADMFRWKSQRIPKYITHNPDTIFLDTNESATKQDEYEIHRILKPYKIKPNAEWYYNSDKVHQVWNDFKNKYKDNIDSLES